MKYNSVFGTDMKVSSICLGTMTFGAPVAENEAIGLVLHGLDSGINFIDTANMYEGYARVPGSMGGVAEEILGKALKGRRNSAIIATKLGMKVGDMPEDEFTSPAAIKKQLEKSLQRLKTDIIDIYYLHKHDSAVPPAEIAGAMAEEIKKGNIRSYAVSNYTHAQLEALVTAAELDGLPTPVMCQPPLSLLKQESLGDIIPYCSRRKIAVIPYQILQGGLLTGKYKRGAPIPANSRKAEKPDWLWDFNDTLFDRLEEIEGTAAAEGLDMTSYAMCWALRQPGVASVIAGVKSIQQIDAAVAAAGKA